MRRDHKSVNEKNTTWNNSCMHAHEKLCNKSHCLFPPHQPHHNTKPCTTIVTLDDQLMPACMELAVTGSSRTEHASPASPATLLKAMTPPHRLLLQVQGKRTSTDK